MIIIHDFNDPSKVLFQGTYGAGVGSNGQGIGNNNGNNAQGFGNGNGNGNGNTVINLGGDYNIAGFGGAGNNNGNDAKGSGNGNGNGNGNNVFNFDYYNPANAGSSYIPKSVDSIYASEPSQEEVQPVYTPKKEVKKAPVKPQVPSYINSYIPPSVASYTSYASTGSSYIPFPTKNKPEQQSAKPAKTSKPVKPAKQSKTAKHVSSYENDVPSYMSYMNKYAPGIF